MNMANFWCLNSKTLRTTKQWLKERTTSDKGVGKGEAGGAEAPPDFKLVLLCVQTVAGKLQNVEKQEEKTAFRL